MGLRVSGDLDLVKFRQDAFGIISQLAQQARNDYVTWAAEKLAAARKEFGSDATEELEGHQLLPYTKTPRSKPTTRAATAQKTSRQTAITTSSRESTTANEGTTRLTRRAAALQDSTRQNVEDADLDRVELVLVDLPPAAKRKCSRKMKGGEENEIVPSTGRVTRAATAKRSKATSGATSSRRKKNSTPPVSSPVQKAPSPQPLRVCQRTSSNSVKGPDDVQAGVEEETKEVEEEERDCEGRVSMRPPSLPAVAAEQLVQPPPTESSVMLTWKDTGDGDNGEDDYMEDTAPSQQTQSKRAPSKAKKAPATKKTKGRKKAVGRKKKGRGSSSASCVSSVSGVPSPQTSLSSVLIEDDSQTVYVDAESNFNPTTPPSEEALLSQSAVVAVNDENDDNSRKDSPSGLTSSSPERKEEEKQEDESVKVGEDKTFPSYVKTPSRFLANRRKGSFFTQTEHSSPPPPPPVAAFEGAEEQEEGEEGTMEGEEVMEVSNQITSIDDMKVVSSGGRERSRGNSDGGFATAYEPTTATTYEPTTPTTTATTYEPTTPTTTAACVLPVVPQPPQGTTPTVTDNPCYSSNEDEDDGNCLDSQPTNPTNTTFTIPSESSHIATEATSSLTGSSVLNDTFSLSHRRLHFTGPGLGESGEGGSLGVKGKGSKQVPSKTVPLLDSRKESLSRFFDSLMQKSHGGKSSPVRSPSVARRSMELMIKRGSATMNYVRNKLKPPPVPTPASLREAPVVEEDGSRTWDNPACAIEQQQQQQQQQKVDGKARKSALLPPATTTDSEPSSPTYRKSDDEEYFSADDEDIDGQRDRNSGSANRKGKFRASSSRLEKKGRDEVKEVTEASSGDKLKGSSQVTTFSYGLRSTTTLTTAIPPLTATTTTAAAGGGGTSVLEPTSTTTASSGGDISSSGEKKREKRPYEDSQLAVWYNGIKAGGTGSSTTTTGDSGSKPKKPTTFLTGGMGQFEPHSVLTKQKVNVAAKLAPYKDLKHILQSSSTSRVYDTDSGSVAKSSTSSSSLISATSSTSSSQTGSARVLTTFLPQPPSPPPKATTSAVERAQQTAKRLDQYEKKAREIELRKQREREERIRKQKQREQEVLQRKAALEQQEQAKRENMLASKEEKHRKKELLAQRRLEEQEQQRRKMDKQYHAVLGRKKQQEEEHHRRLLAQLEEEARIVAENEARRQQAIQARLDAVAADNEARRIQQQQAYEEEKLKQKLREEEKIRVLVAEVERMKGGAGKVQANPRPVASSSVPQVTTSSQPQHSYTTSAADTQSSFKTPSHPSSANPLRPLPTQGASSYQMTPDVLAAADTYDIDDLSSDDDTDDEDHPSKPVPEWAKPANVFASVRRQQGVDPEGIFPPHQLLGPPNLDLIFRRKRQRYHQRTSSANWGTPPYHIRRRSPSPPSNSPPQSPLHKKRLDQSRSKQ